MVRLRVRRVRKKYLGGKRVYSYRQILLPIPARFRRIVEEYLDRDLEIDVARLGYSLLIRLDPVPEEKPYPRLLLGLEEVPGRTQPRWRRVEHPDV